MASKKKSFRIWNDNLYAAHTQSIDLIIETVRNDNELLFLTRGNMLNVYYLGTVILEYNGIYYKLNPNYTKNITPVLPHIFKDVYNWRNSLPALKDAMRIHNGSKTEEKKKGKQKEKAAQQRIIQKVNTNPNSQYYILDMEYSYPGFSFGRADMLAVSKDPVNGKHKIAFIELKCGANSFGTTIKNDVGENKNPYGSGIVGHAYNFHKFFYCPNDDAVKLRLKNVVAELSSMSKVCNRFNLPPSDYLLKLEADDFDIDVDEIRTWLLCVDCSSVESAKSSVLNYLGCPQDNGKGCLAKYTVRNDVSPDIKFCYQVTSAPDIDSLMEKDFINPRG